MGRTLLRILFGLLLFIVLPGCGGVGSGGLATETGGADPLSAGETDLYSDGPVDLPVTIAKLESPNPAYIDVTVGDDLPRLGRDVSAQWLSSDTTYPVTFEGQGDATDASVRAIRDPEATPYVLVYANGTSTVAPVNADGSFSVDVESNIEEDIAVLAMTSDDVANAAASPAVLYSIDELGTVTVTITNSSRINDTMPFASDPYGNILFSITEDDGSYTLWRRNLDGSLPEVLLQSNPDEIIAVASMSDVGGMSDVMDTTVVMDAGVNLTTITESDSGFTSSLLAEALGNFNDIDNIASQRYRVESAGTDRVLVMRQIDFVGVPGAPPEYTKVIEVYWTDGSQMATILGETDAEGAPRNIEHMKFAFNSDRSKLFVVVTENDEPITDIYTLDFLPGMQKTDYETLWAARETVITDLPYAVQGMDVRSNGSLVLLAYNPATDGAEIGVIEEGSQTFTSLVDAGASGYSPYSWIRVGGSDDSLALICGSKIVDSTTEYRLTVLPIAEPPYTFVDFSSNTKLRSCNHIKGDNAGHLHFFTSAEEGEPSQMSFIDMTKSQILQALQ